MEIRTRFEGTMRRIAHKIRVTVEGMLLGTPAFAVDPRRIDLCGCMPSGEERLWWGDWYYAQSLKRELKGLGYQVRILPHDCWGDPSNAAVTIVLRGLYPYHVTRDIPDKRFIMWNISHPADVSADECNHFDHVIFASKRHQAMLQDLLEVPSSVLPQCTDERTIAYVPRPKRFELLFVGNSRGVYRRILRDLLPTEHRLDVFGRGWESFPVQDHVTAPLMPNGELGQAYHDAKIVLNDHWDDMREYGIVSNRVFDVLAAEGFVISDAMSELEELFGGAVVSYEDREELKRLVDWYLSHDDERHEKASKGRAIVLAKHTFRHRAQELDRLVRQLRRRGQQ